MPTIAYPLGAPGSRNSSVQVGLGQVGNNVQ